MNVISWRRAKRVRQLAGLVFVVWCIAATIQAFGGDKAVSPMRYRATPSVTFEHSKHSKDCASCHATSNAVADDLGPGMEVCAACHGSQEPTLQRCGACHAGVPDSKTPVTTKAQWQAVRPAPFIPPRQVADLKFNHAKHATLGAQCVTCHAGPNPQLPSMQVCTDCHTSKNAPLACQSCHTTPVDGGRALKPHNHDLDWLKRHGVVASAQPDDCMSCHTQTDCASCHANAAKRPFEIHPPNFVTIHAVDARADEQNCTSCHSVQNFCTACHVRANVTAREDARPPSTVQFHPVGFLDASSANNHGIMARRNIVDCASCHSERDCVTCHAAINPHPADFRVDCRRWLDANPRPCAKCHDDPTLLRARCF